MMSARIELDLSRRLSGDPKTPIEAILTAADGLDELLAELGPDIQVDYTYRLTASVAVTAPAGALRRLADRPAVKSIEPVRSVKSQ
jgi:hypothetical protein